MEAAGNPALVEGYDLIGPSAAAAAMLYGRAEWVAEHGADEMRAAAGDDTFREPFDGSEC